MPDLHSKLLRIASELPQGDSTRRDILAALKREADDVARPIRKLLDSAGKDTLNQLKRQWGGQDKWRLGSGSGHGTLTNEDVVVHVWTYPDTSGDLDTGMSWERVGVDVKVLVDGDDDFSRVDWSRGKAPRKLVDSTLKALAKL